MQLFFPLSSVLTHCPLKSHLSDLLYKLPAVQCSGSVLWFFLSLIQIINRKFSFNFWRQKIPGEGPFEAKFASLLCVRKNQWRRTEIRRAGLSVFTQAVTVNMIQPELLSLFLGFPSSLHLSSSFRLNLEADANSQNIYSACCSSFPVTFCACRYSFNYRWKSVTSIMLICMEYLLRAGFLASPKFWRVKALCCYCQI